MLLCVVGRDHGLPTFLEARRQCGFSADFKSFDDLLQIFPKANVDLLQETYDLVDDIDLYVGGALETFQTIDQVLAGDTLGCIIGEHYRQTISGDAYFFSHPTNPYPFTREQIQAINGFTFANLICKNSNIETILKLWLEIESLENPKTMCSDLKDFNAEAWRENSSNNVFSYS